MSEEPETVSTDQKVGKDGGQMTTNHKPDRSTESTQYGPSPSKHKP